MFLRYCKHAFAIAFAIVMTSPVLASSPGMIEGPPGCNWNATVVDTDDTNRTMNVLLGSIHGSCMYEACTENHTGITLAISLKNDDKSHKKGDTVNVWVTGNSAADAAASLEMPVCTKEPM